MAIVLWSSTLFAQNDYPGTGGINKFFNGDGFLRPGEDGNGMETEAGVKPNAIKINLTALGANNIAIQYERALADHFSFAVQGRYTLEIKPQDFISSNFESTGTLADSVSASFPMLGGFAITPEFRYYPKNVMKGFYLGPYLRYRQNTVNMPFSYYDDNNIQVNQELNGKVNTVIFGLMFGVHAALGKRVSMDIFIAGLQYGASVGNLDYSSSTTVFSATDQQEIINGIEDFKNNALVDLNFDYTVTDKSVGLETRFAAPGIRLFGINLGYRF